jgi:hypothetical protein
MEQVGYRVPEPGNPAYSTLSLTLSLNFSDSDTDGLGWNLIKINYIHLRLSITNIIGHHTHKCKCH